MIDSAAWVHVEGREITFSEKSIHDTGVSSRLSFDHLYIGSSIGIEKVPPLAI